MVYATRGVPSICLKFFFGNPLEVPRAGMIQIGSVAVTDSPTSYRAHRRILTNVHSTGLPLSVLSYHELANAASTRAGIWTAYLVNSADVAFDSSGGNGVLLVPLGQRVDDPFHVSVRWNVIRVPRLRDVRSETDFVQVVGKRKASCSPTSNPAWTELSILYFFCRLDPTDASPPTISPPRKAVDTSASVATSECQMSWLRWDVLRWRKLNSSSRGGERRPSG